MDRLSKAFTLIELAVVLLVVSLMVGFGMQAFQGNTSLTCYDKTESQLKAIDRALENFAASNNRLPKPAFLGYGSSNAQFGYEAADGADGDTNPDDATAAAYATMVPSGMSNSGGVLIGAIPHAALGLPIDYAADCWGSKFTYAVTNMLTSSHASGYPSAPGAITLNTNTTAAPTLLSSAISYLALSHGQDKFGATPMSAGDITPINCNGTSSTKIDRENCNTSDAVFYNAARNTGTAGATSFDDVVIYNAKTSLSCPAGTAIWGGGCSAAYGALAHGANASVTATSGGTGTATVTCSNANITVSSPVCSTPCDSDASNGLTAGTKYCAGVTFSQCSGYLTQVSPDIYNSSCACNSSLCASGSSAAALTDSDRTGCTCCGYPFGINPNCYDTFSCTCN